MSISPTARIAPTTSHPMRRAGDIVIDADSGTALAPTAPVMRSIPASLRSARPDPSFVMHLIASAEQVPQTRALRRADVAEVDAAYRAAGAYAGSAKIMTRVV